MRPSHMITLLSKEICSPNCHQSIILSVVFSFWRSIEKRASRGDFNEATMILRMNLGIFLYSLFVSPGSRNLRESEVEIWGLLGEIFPMVNTILQLESLLKKKKANWTFHLRVKAQKCIRMLYLSFHEQSWLLCRLLPFVLLPFCSQYNQQNFGDSLFWAVDSPVVSLYLGAENFVTL